jgi:GINS complex subunit 2
MAKMRASVKTLEGGGLISLMGVGAMEISEGRQFIVGVMDGLRKLGESREVARRAREEDGNEGVDSDDEDMDMGFE